MFNNGIHGYINERTIVVLCIICQQLLSNLFYNRPISCIIDIILLPNKSNLRKTALAVMCYIVISRIYIVSTCFRNL